MKPNKCFIASLSENFEDIFFPLTGGSGKKSNTVMIERSPLTFLVIIENISLNLESVSVHRSLDTIESYSWYSCRSRWKNSRFFKAIRLIRQYFWYTLRMIFKKWYISVLPLPRRNIELGSTLCSLCFT